MKFTLAFALHNHQPVGNFDFVFESAHRDCYLPFLQLVKQHPRFRFSLHQSGILWEWQRQHHPEFFDLTAELTAAGQMELLTGAFYEPILPAIPDRDKLGQMMMLTRYLHDHFKVTPRGMWLAERVWEPNLPGVIHDCGIDFLPLDDTHFKYTGLKDDELFGTYITEDAGKTVTLLPIRQKLRYLIPFGAPEEIIAYLKQAAEHHPNGLAVYADDGEKFGVWPETHRHCYTDRWLERFFTALEQNSDWLQVVPLGEVVAGRAPIGRVYLPSASYREMLQWALPAVSFVELEEFEEKLSALGLLERYGHFVRGGHWRGFLAKYTEANLMHKKMLAVSDLCHSLETQAGLDQTLLAEAREHLYAGQCNCPYWHGVFGGLYLPHLRQAVYRELVAAETTLRRISGQVARITCEDRDRDGYEDIIISGEDLAMVISPARGGQIVEWDSLKTGHNLTDCLSRRHEGYHHKLLQASSGTPSESAKSIHEKVMVKEPGLERLLVEDKYLRRPLTDHFLTPDATLDDFMSGHGGELGDFVDGCYAYTTEDAEREFVVRLSRRGRLQAGDQQVTVQVQKTIRFPRAGNIVFLDYRVSPQAPFSMPVRFAVEFDFNLLAPEASDRYAVIDGARPEQAHLAALAETSSATRIAYLDQYQQVGIAIEADHSARLWRLPIYTVSLSEAGFEKVFQGNCTMFLYDLPSNGTDELIVCFSVYAGPLAGLPENRLAGEMAANRS